MVGFLGTTSAELAEVPTVAGPLIATELHSVLLALGGDTFGPGLIYTTGLITVTGKTERVPGDVRMRINRVHCDLSPGAPAE